MSSTAADAGTAAGLLRLGNQFCDAKALLTAVRLDLFGALQHGPASTEELRQRLGLHGRGLSDFLGLLAALGLLCRDADGRFRNAEGADRCLVPGRPGCVAGFLTGADVNLYPVYGRLTDAVRTGKPQADGDFTGMLDDPEALGGFVRMMDGLTQGLGGELSAVLEGIEYHSVLDAGGCRGHLLGQLLADHDGLTGQVFDLPQMEPFFHAYMAELGLSGRTSFHPGDFFRDPLPQADVIVLGHILHDWDAAQRQELLDKAYRAVSPGGTVLVYDRMLGRRADDTENLVASLNMLLVTEGGGEYSAEDVTEQARRAGFSSVTDRPLADFDTLVICRKG
ncbi:methyltransferase [Streptomyces sp. H10-C2]|uniref:methyltransferase n=1 Tax=unclassified Streptomyces TaxID=2593676 RepID=UPI0024BBEA62|nr:MULTISPECIES: methyltransferase [unclassified Streptomyces]MDJ0345996.1 methyltransferase [Streptomyces sp. PH10-H1]MDJ0370497.1 methyltransferase [Streptomyces sp. H10-C2]